MPLQNRVTPAGDIIATPHRGLLMGNRGGAFHLPDRTLGSRRWASRQWIACVLAFKDRHRPAMMQPHRYTELFFLDEATALAAGHRPCFECRRRDAEQFAMLWAQARNWPAPARAPEMDLVLQAERVGRHGHKVTFMAQLGSLPVGSFIRLANAPESYGVTSVSGRTTRTEAVGIPSTSDTICARAVSDACPMSTVPHCSAQLPSP